MKKLSFTCLKPVLLLGTIALMACVQPEANSRDDQGSAGTVLKSVKLSADPVTQSGEVKDIAITAVTETANRFVSKKANLKIGIPQAFFNDIENEFKKLADVQPEIQRKRGWLADYGQLTSLQDLKSANAGAYAYLVFATEGRQPETSDWLARVVVDLEKWKIVDSEANTTLDGSYQPMRLPMTKAQGHLRHAVRFAVDSKNFNRGLLKSKLYLGVIFEEAVAPMLIDRDQHLYRIDGAAGPQRIAQ